MENMYNVNSSKFQCAICYQDNGITDDPNDYSEYMGTPAQPAVLGRFARRGVAEVEAKAAKAILEFEERWREILSIQMMKTPCTMDSFDEIYRVSHLITQFCLENTSDPHRGVTEAPHMKSNIERLEIIENVLGSFRSWLKRHYWKESLLK